MLRAPNASLVVILAASLMGCQTPLNLEGSTTPEIADRLIAAGRIPGISYAVLSGGVTTASGAAGVADLGTGELVRTDTLFEAASLTKPVVAAIAMRLFAAGRFELDEPVAASVESPRIEDRALYRKVTPRHLLAHMSGLPNWSGDPLDVARTDRLDFSFPPGSEFSYSGEGYEILQQFLEKKSGQSMRELSQALFDELGMTSSTLVGESHAGDTARGHWGRSPTRMARRSQQPIAAFSMLTHAEDYSRFLAYLLHKDSFPPFVLNEFRKPQIGIEPSLAWSLGWGVLERAEGDVYFQWGDNGPFRSFAAFDPGAKSAIVYFVNGSDGLRYTAVLARPSVGDVETATEWFSRPSLEWIRKIIRY